MRKFAAAALKKITKSKKKINKQTWHKKTKTTLYSKRNKKKRGKQKKNKKIKTKGDFVCFLIFYDFFVLFVLIFWSVFIFLIILCRCLIMCVSCCMKSPLLLLVKNIIRIVVIVSYSVIAEWQGLIVGSGFQFK